MKKKDNPNQHIQTLMAILPTKPEPASNETPTDSPTPPTPIPPKPKPNKVSNETEVATKPNPLSTKPIELVAKPTPPPPKPSEVSKETEVATTEINKPKKIIPPISPIKLLQEVLDEGKEWEETTDDSMFQAIGVITGIVEIKEDNHLAIAIDGKKYALYISKYEIREYNKLREKVKESPDQIWRLVVYPRVLHVPQQPHQINFNLVGFDTGIRKGVSTELKDFEFKLCGVWQFIPVCRIPCITVYKNFSCEKLYLIKNAPPDQRVQLMKPLHVPVMWQPSPIKPFRFNPKLQREEQGNPLFVEVLAKFVPNTSTFEIIDTISPPKKQPPQSLRVNKRDKAIALKEKRKLQRKQEAKG
jgi:hypothetical protein